MEYTVVDGVGHIIDCLEDEITSVDGWLSTEYGWEFWPQINVQPWFIENWTRKQAKRRSFLGVHNHHVFPKRFIEGQASYLEAYIYESCLTLNMVLP